ncbi:hypothetical protein BWQ96_00524 [Gracilariopsis chorda]|uniref:Uncharacterized protein n=1 Tax=Gracilariopsis chorda TaxID=448386 RepID=A0A2V3J5D4_9FLOR|nr:hypothetical protein BWQ96_00524 [Gracilariopsis chorda]|eukprot:PXF49646.1 hypothetical protein BWQ96_00524 [Gracilariopsis chorda]
MDKMFTLFMVKVEERTQKDLQSLVRMIETCLRANRNLQLCEFDGTNKQSAASQILKRHCLRQKLHWADEIQ